MINNSKNQKGFLTLMGTLLVAAIGISISVSLLLLGLGASRTSFAISQTYQAISLSNACAEEALQQIYDSMAQETPALFVGSGTLNLGQGTCLYNVVDNGNDTRKIMATGTVGTVVRKDQIIVSSANPVVISSWNEVPDFN